MKTGDIVEVQGGYFKSDNGLFIIVHSPGDINWYGNDWCLKRLNKNLTPSKSKYKMAFFPLSVTISDRVKAEQAKEHNAKYATIRVIKQGD